MTRIRIARSLFLIAASASALAAVLPGCGSGTDQQRATGGAGGTGPGAGGTSDPSGTTDPSHVVDLSPSGTSSPPASDDPDANPCGTTIPVLYRDMKFSSEPGGHPDFERTTGQDDIGCGIVDTDLTSDHKPVFQASNGTGQRILASGVFDHCISPWPYTPSMIVVQSATTFQSWYHTDSQFSKEIDGSLTLTETPAGSGKYVYDSTAFFPIDNQGWGNSPGQQHNYGFTTEIHLLFGYVRGQKFTFRGDDDLWIFVNDKLALDLGGCHNALQGTIDFDVQSAELDITPGRVYAMDIFHAERHTTASNFRIETNISCFQPVTYDVR